MLNSEEPGLVFHQEPFKHNQLEEYSDGPPSLPSSSAFEINPKSLASTSRDQKFLGFKTRYFVILLNIVLMTLTLAGVVTWSWNNHWMAAALSVAVLCIHAILWLNIFLFKRSLLYMLFLVVYAVLVVLEVIYVIVFLIVAFSQKNSIDSTSTSSQQLSSVVVMMILLAGLIILILGFLLEVGVYKLLHLEPEAYPKEENLDSRQDMTPETFIKKEILTSTQTVHTGNSTLKNCWMIDQRQVRVFSKEFPTRRLSWA